MFSFVRACHRGCTISCSHQQCMRFQFPHIHANFSHFLFLFFDIASPMSVEWYFIVVLICISLTRNVAWCEYAVKQI
jgi:hypothetical protein